MELKVNGDDGIDSWKEVNLIYNAALKQMETKMEILNDEFQHVHQYNPIEHIKARIKSPESIVKKLKRHGRESTIENMVNHINDIAGIRIICSFSSDIYRIAEMIREQKDIKVIGIKDYITYPKASGYRSYHMIVTVPVYLSDRIVDAKVEVQIRTVAMDFWASLEHKMYYKFEGNAPENIRRELKECADLVSFLDRKMLAINEEIKKYSEDEEEEQLISESLRRLYGMVNEEGDGKESVDLREKSAVVIDLDEGQLRKADRDETEGVGKKKLFAMSKSKR